MNPDLPATNVSSAPQIQNPKSKIHNVIGVSSGHKRNGKIAHLPKAVRDKINQWIDDGHTYPQIIKDLGEDAKDLKPNHFSEWRKGGYQDYLRHQEWRDELRLLRENGSEISELDDGPVFQQNLIQLALTEIFRVLQQRELKSDSLNFIRLFNALARLNREALGLRKYNDLLAKQEAELKKLEIGRKISTNEHRAIVDQADQIFRMPRPRPEQDGTKLATNRGEEPQTNDRLAPSDSRNTSGLSIENRNSKIKNSPFPSTPDPRPSCSPPPSTPPTPPPEHCLECGCTLPPVPPDARRRPDDHCPSCGIRLPDIGLCYQPGFDKCFNCGATQPHLLPNKERPRPNCHKCGERLHNPEIPARPAINESNVLSH